MAETMLGKIVREAYDRRAESGDEFTIEEVVEDVLEDPTLDSVSVGLIEEAVAGKVRSVDRSRTNRDDAQGVLFGDCEQIIPLGEGRRRRKGSLTAADVLAHLALVEENLRAVQAAADLERREAEALLPYMLERNLVWEQAVEAYLDDHPEAGS